MFQMQEAWTSQQGLSEKNKTTGTPQEAQKKMTPREMYKHIRSLTAQLNDEEKTEFFKEAEEEGF